MSKLSTFIVLANKKITEMSESGEDEIIKKLAMGNVKLFEIKNIALDKLLERLQELENPQERYSYGYKRDSRREVRNNVLFFKGLNQQAREFLELDEPETTKNQ